MMKMIFKYWKGWKRSAKDRACISVPPAPGVCIIWYMKSWTMLLTRHWQDTAI